MERGEYVNLKINPQYYNDGDVSSKRALESMMSNCNLKPATSFWWGCAFKYLWRWPKKNKLEDLEKCKACIEYLIESYKKDEGIGR